MELRETWLGLEEAVADKRGEISQMLTDYKQAHRRADGLAAEIGITLAIPSPEGMTGDKIANDLGPELVEVIGEIKMIPSRIDVAISELEALSVQRDTATRNFFGQVKRR